VPNRPRWIVALLVSLLLTVPPVRAAQQLEVELDGLRLPIDLSQLEEWSRDPDTSDGDLALWLNLLDPADRASLIRLLRAPLIKERSFGLQLLNSWTGERMLHELGGLLTQPDGATTMAELDSTLRRLLERRGVVTTLDLLEALPGDRLVLRLDGLLNLAQRWRLQLQEQEVAMGQLHRLRVPLRNSRAHAPPGLARLKPQRVELNVAHRPTPLPLELWPSRVVKPSPWLVMMPGLGGNSTELSWLAASLSAQGWPVLVVEHPGSNRTALQASLQGDLPPPGADSLPGRLADLQAVLAARRDGLLPPLGPSPAGEQGVVLLGHSLGGLTALMASGLVPERGLGERCRQALAALPLTNLSRLLQCQLPQITGESSGGSALPDPLLEGSTRLRGVVAYNGFGSLLWPRGGLAALDLPVLLVGGSLDLVTPPVQEQLSLFQEAAHPFSRLVLVEGGSHFSPVRIVGDGKAAFRLSDELVGVEPRKVQELLLSITLEFLEGLDHPSLLPAQRRQQNGVVAYVLDAAQARRWSSLIRTAPADPAGPSAGRPAR
jgi:predicted dienelactone hydrolase